MTTKDYILIANVLKTTKQKDYIHEDVFRNIIDLFCIELRNNNASFDSNKFKEYINK